MSDSGYINFDDPRLTPAWVYDSQDVTPTYCHETCAHAGACRMQLARLRGWDVAEDGLAWMETLADDLGCGETCEQYDEA